MSDPSRSEQRNALSQLDIAHWYRRVYAQCQAKLLSAADAEDAVQETFLRAVRRIDDLRTPEALGAWLRGIAHHVCVDTIRKNRVRQVTSQAPQDLAAAESQSTQETAGLQSAVHELPEPLREVILLHYYEKMTYDQMADWLGVARSTVNDRLSRARAALKQQLVRDGSPR